MVKFENIFYHLIQYSWVSCCDLLPIISVLVMILQTFERSQHIGIKTVKSF